MTTAIVEPTATLPEPTNVRTKDRSIDYDWFIREEEGTRPVEDGETPGRRRVYANLTIMHHTGGVNYLAGTQHGNHFSASLSNETAEDVIHDGRKIGESRGFFIGRGLGLAREDVGRFSKKRMETFAAAALEQLRELYEAGDERVMRYFRPVGEAAEAPS